MFDYTFEVVASNLDNPRGLTFGEDGELYIVEAGRGGEGPTIPGPELGIGLSYGATGAIVRLANGEQERLVEGLASFIEFETETGEFISRPTGLGAHELVFDDEGNPFVLIGYGSAPAFQDELGEVGTDFGRLARLDLETGTIENRADFITYEAENNPDGSDSISNPYSLVYDDGEFYAIDAGANALLQVNGDGTEIGNVSTFPSRLFPNPFSPEEEIPVQSVPTSITVGPDDAFYVGELTGFPYPANEARVYRLEEAGAEPTVFAEGFTQIIDLEFDEEGNLFVLEFSVDPLIENNPQGALIQVAEDGTQTVISGEELILPTEIAIDDRGDIYVSNSNFALGEGEVLRYSQAATPSNLVFGSPEADELDGEIDSFEGQTIAFSGGDSDLVDVSQDSGDNRIYGGSDDDELIAGSGDWPPATGIANRLFGGSGNDTIEASLSLGEGRFYGGVGSDNFFLGTGDRLMGGEGDDAFFVGEAGDNIITGGLGADQFWIANGDIPPDTNTITDYTQEDIIGVGGLGISTVEELTFTQDGEDSIISLGDRDLARLLQVDVATVASGEFVFRR